MGSRTRGTADALAGSIPPWPCQARDLPDSVGPYVAAASGEWPRGIHWTPGEVRTLPPAYPVEGPPPSWIAPVGDP